VAVDKAPPTPGPGIVLGCSFDHGKRRWQWRWWRRKLTLDNDRGGRGRRGGGKANVAKNAFSVAIV
jgi:hypothetical protein